ncbi:MAG: NAD-dependent epimerase/dehydratase family protein [Planctomycetaceae bacterium]
MRIAVTGATGFCGRYLVRQLVEQGHQCRCWYRPTSDRSGLSGVATHVEWCQGELGDPGACAALVDGCDAVVHAGLHRQDAAFRGGEGDPVAFVEKNVVGSLQLIEASRRADVSRFVFVSTCAVHERILDDRTLDEAHPLWPTSLYGAYKAAVEKFVHGFGFGDGFPICSIRPTGIYGVARPVAGSKWFSLVRSVVKNAAVHCDRGGKEVHVADVARAIDLLLTARGVAGESFNCYDRYVSQFEVAMLAREMSGSSSVITGGQTAPKHQISVEKIKRLGMRFGGADLLRQTIADMVQHLRSLE